jgi:hypothetical protein
MLDALRKAALVCNNLFYFICYEAEIWHVSVFRIYSYVWAARTLSR